MKKKIPLSILNVPFYSLEICKLKSILNLTLTNEWRVVCHNLMLETPNKVKHVSMLVDVSKRGCYKCIINYHPPTNNKIRVRLEPHQFS